MAVSREKKATFTNTPKEVEGKMEVFVGGTKNIERRCEKNRVFGGGLNIRFLYNFMYFNDVF